ncbi:MAG: hypothetical protein MUO82_08070 [Candidatus Thermoplasmatota archaeon]|nr:hypothetical protein [Candidatus Thermoplasmatota archaeon]
MKCLNTYGCQNEAVVGSNFCSEKCRFIYRGELEPDYSNYKPYTESDKKKKIVDYIFQKYYGCNQEQKKPPGVKPGTKRGSYNKPGLEKKEKLLKERQHKKSNRLRVRRYRQRKKELQLKQKGLGFNEM